MRNSIFTMVAAAALLAVGSAYAGDSSSSSTDTDANQIICKSGPPPTGTRLGPTRVCKTKQQWDQEQQQAQDTLTRVQINRGLSNTGN